MKWGRSPAVPRQREHLVDRGLGGAPVDKELTEVKPSHPKGLSFLDTPPWPQFCTAVDAHLTAPAFLDM
jgi:hypothetical protein